MSLMQSRAVGLPVEVADMILNWIYRRRDLLSLALSHSRFYRLIVPDHLHYRHVEFCIFDYTMWKYLSGDSARLKRIETIKLSAHAKPRVPPITNPSGNQLSTLAEAKKVNSGLIYNALKGMRLLHAVIWDSEQANCHSTDRIMDLQRNIWEAVDRYCPTVQRVDSRGSYSCLRSYIGSEGEASPPLSTLSQITTLTYQQACYCWSLWTEHRSISFLSSFQGLQHLMLPQAGSLPGDILDVLAIKFPLLESLTLGGLTSVTIDNVLEFLAAHPLLRALEFGGLGGPLSANPSNISTIAACNVAPRLETLRSPRNLVQVLFQTSDNGSDCRRLLRSLCTALPLDTQNSPEDLDILFRIGAQLEELTVGDKHEAIAWRCPDLGSPLRIISSAFPNLRLLDIGSVYNFKCSAPSGCARPKVHDWIFALSTLIHLVALTIPWTKIEDNGFMVQSSPSKRRHKTMEQFLNHCPQLRFLFSVSYRTWERPKVSVLIGYSDADIRFRGAHLIDEGAVGNRKWAAYNGDANDLTDEISAAVRARAR